MQAETFWKSFLDHRVEKITGEVLEFFQTPLSEEDLQAYEWAEVITEYVSAQKRAKKFDEIAQLSEILQANNPQVYQESHVYLNGALTTYYCYKRDVAGLSKIVEQWTSQPLEFDMLALSFKKITYYGYSELADKIIERWFPAVKQSPDLLSGAEVDLSVPKLHIELEKFYHSLDHPPHTIDWQSFKATMAAYDFEFKEDYLPTLARAIQADAPKALAQEISEEFGAEKRHPLNTLGMLFGIQMLNKQMGFPTSGIIWYHLKDYWGETEGKTSSWSDYFRIKEESFPAYIRKQRGFFMDYRFLQAVILWGSSYVMDFLHELDLLRTDRYRESIQVIDEQKTIFKKVNRNVLWEYDPVHAWLPPASVTPEEWAAEQAHFQNSFDQDIEPLPLKEQARLEDRPYVDPASLLRKSKPRSEPRPKSGFQPPKKIGRNDKVSVRYQDGTVQTDVKYKKVLPDLEAGKCELI